LWFSPRIPAPGLGLPRPTPDRTPRCHRPCSGRDRLPTRRSRTGWWPASMRWRLGRWSDLRIARPMKAAIHMFFIITSWKVPEIITQRTRTCRMLMVGSILSFRFPRTQLPGRDRLNEREDDGRSEVRRHDEVVGRRVDSALRSEGGGWRHPRPRWPCRAPTRDLGCSGRYLPERERLLLPGRMQVRPRQDLFPLPQAVCPHARRQVQVQREGPYLQTALRRSLRPADRMFVNP